MSFNFGFGGAEDAGFGGNSGFGSAQAPEKSDNTGFGSSSNSGFGSSAPVNNGFGNSSGGFGSSTPASNGFGNSNTGFGAPVPQAAAPASNGFGNSNNGFGAPAPQAAAPASNGFGNSSSGFGSSAPANNSFGNSSFGSSAPANNSFGNSNFGSSSPANNSFGNSNFGSSAPANNSFGNDSFGSSAPANNSFGNDSFGSSAPANNIFGNDSFGSSAPANNSFGNDSFGSSAPANNSFGNDSFGSSAPANTSNGFEGDDSTSTTAAAPADDFFGGGNTEETEEADESQSGAGQGGRKNITDTFAAPVMEGTQIASLTTSVDDDDDSLWEGEIKVALSDPNSPIYSEVSDFKQLNLNDELIKGLNAMMYLKPSKVQAMVLPYILSETPINIVAQSHTGSGKTGAFALGILSKVIVTEAYPQALVLCPTRELAFQNAQVIRKMGEFTEVKVLLSIPGDDDLTYYFDSLQPVVHHVIVGTPGKVYSLIAKRLVDPYSIFMVVLDEADALLDDIAMSGDTEKVVNRLNEEVQYLLFSATFNETVLDFIDQAIPNPSTFTYEKESWSLDSIKQYVIDTESRDNRYEVLQFLFDRIQMGKIIIFCGYRHVAHELALRLEGDGHSVTYLMGSLHQEYVRQEPTYAGEYAVDGVDGQVAGFDEEFDREHNLTNPLNVTSITGSHQGAADMDLPAKDRKEDLGNHWGNNDEQAMPTEEGDMDASAEGYGENTEESMAAPLQEGTYMTQQERLDNLRKFKEGKTKILVTTNLLARGLDVKQVNCVINYDPPLTKDKDPDFDTYLHRIGRTGRFGRAGIAINFIYDHNSKQVFDDISQYYNKPMYSIDITNDDQINTMLTLTK